MRGNEDARRRDATATGPNEVQLQCTDIMARP
jgi:hypothetical protein